MRRSKPTIKLPDGKLNQGYIQNLDSQLWLEDPALGQGKLEQLTEGENYFFQV